MTTATTTTITTTTAAIIDTRPNAHRPRQREERATSKEGIKKIAQKVWRQVTPAYLETLYESMPRRMQAVVEAQGGHTKY